MKIVHAFLVLILLIAHHLTFAAVVDNRGGIDLVLPGSVRASAMKFSNDHFINQMKGLGLSNSEIEFAFKFISSEALISSSLSPVSKQIPWKTNEDGCTSRAAVAAHFLNELLGIPNKMIFAFGSNLGISSVNKGSQIIWKFHVAVILPSLESNEWLVLDPSLHPQRPLAVGEWIALIDRVGDATVAICEAGAVFPEDSCGKSKIDNLQSHFEVLQNIIAQEEKNQTR